MSRFLFVVPPLTGHINPTVAVGAELTARGHEVAWAGQTATLRTLLAEGARVFPASDGGVDWRLPAEPGRRPPPRGPEALQHLWANILIPLGHAMLPGVEAAVTRFKPDVIVADQQAVAGAVAARRAGTALATSTTTPGELLRPPMSRHVDDWIRDQMFAFQRAYGIADPTDLRFSSELVLVFSTAALIGDVSRFGGRYIFAGPALTARPDRVPFPWEWLDPGRRHVLVSLGTLSQAAGERFFRTAVDALAPLGGELQAIIVAPPEFQARVPLHILFAERVPQLALLPHLSAVVSHGGHNTVSETLAHGLPLVIAPIRDDQPVIAKQVADAGAAVLVRFEHVQAAQLRDAVRAVLGDPRYAAAARRVRDSFAAAGGAATAANRLEQLA